MDRQVYTTPCLTPLRWGHGLTVLTRAESQTYNITVIATMSGRLRPITMHPRVSGWWITSTSVINESDALFPFYSFLFIFIFPFLSDILGCYFTFFIGIIWMTLQSFLIIQCIMYNIVWLWLYRSLVPESSLLSPVKKRVREMSSPDLSGQRPVILPDSPASIITISSDSEEDSAVLEKSTTASKHQSQNRQHNSGHKTSNKPNYNNNNNKSTNIKSGAVSCYVVKNLSVS